jgi:hypothetical protein
VRRAWWLLVTVPNTGTHKEKPKMHKIAVSLAIVCSCALTVQGQGTRAEKAAASSATAILFRGPNFGNVPDAGAWVTVLDTTIKPPGGKDLFIGVSAVSLIININDSAATGALTDSNAPGEIVVRVLVDGKVATPGVVCLDLIQHLTRTRLSTQLSNCTEVDVGPNAGKVTCTSTPGLLDVTFLDASAHSFNFIMQDVSPGDVHNVKVQAQFFAFAFHPGDMAEAIMGARTVTVEQVALDPQ